MDKNKEILELKKLYLIQVEKWETRIFFAVFSIAISLILFYLSAKDETLLAVAAFILIVMGFIEWLLENWRTRKFNELKTEIEKGKFNAIKLKPEKAKLQTQKQK